MSSFSGDGTLAGAPDETDSVVFIPNISVTGSLFLGENAPSLIFTNTFDVPGGVITPTTPVDTVDFTFQGVRTSVFGQGAGGGTTTAASTSTTGG